MENTCRTPSLFSTLTKPAAHAVVGIVALGFGIVSASAAEKCSSIRDSIKASGSYTHHYRDPSHPTIDLFQRYVGSSTQCRAGALLQETTVASLGNCHLGSCMDVYGRGTH